MSLEEFSVIDRLSRGDSVKMISHRLMMKYSRVQAIILRVRQAHNAKNVTHLIGICFRNGILKP